MFLVCTKVAIYVKNSPNRKAHSLQLCRQFFYASALNECEKIYNQARRRNEC